MAVRLGQWPPSHQDNRIAASGNVEKKIAPSLLSSLTMATILIRKSRLLAFHLLVFCFPEVKFQVNLAKMSLAPLFYLAPIRRAETLPHGPQAKKAGAPVALPQLLIVWRFRRKEENQKLLLPLSSLSMKQGCHSRRSWSMSCP